MATVAESSEPNPTPPQPPRSDDPIGKHSMMKTLGETTPWIEYAVQQAQLVQETVESTIEASKSRLSQIMSTSSTHFHQTIDSLEDLKSKYAAYEDMVFGQIKDLCAKGVVTVTSHPLITTGGVAAGLGFMVLKGPRRVLYYKFLHLFESEETLLLKANRQVEGLRRSLNDLKDKSEKLEKSTLHAEEILIRGRTKLRGAGKQIQGVIRSAYKIERQAGGLKDIIGELPRASQFQSQVSNLASEAKRERNALTKEITKISNYGISV
ncbi:RGS1-HXK1-interacting protein 1 [Alnus glutinosa]|uniref:RGS1-HXK1-interacting protein 1 n=1 Tax=Alnus glutinosa TaxID=3517 RepID=UPI002D77856C|nr:RGS1-HXK1-interacting protein 1 [Alnus glutinosa]